MPSIKKILAELSLQCCILAFISSLSVNFVPTALANTSSYDNNELSRKRQQELIHLLLQDCGSCHGMTLKGGLGPALLPQDLEGKPAQFLINTVLYGRPGTAMPPWQGLLSEKEVSFLIATLQQGLINE
jgi:cytochrome c55X